MPSLGRPPKPAEERKANVLRVLLTDDERATVNAVADRQGLQTSTWARLILLQSANPSASPSPADATDAGRALGRLGGSKGGKTRAAILSAERRSEIAREAAAKRWNSKPLSAELEEIEQALTVRLERTA